MVKTQSLKKKLIKLSIVGLVIVSVCAAAAYGVFAWSTSLLDEAKSANSKLSRARGDVSSREQKNREAQGYLELYNEIQGDSEQAKISELDREKAEIWLKEQALRNNIIHLEGSFEPIKPVEASAFKKKTFEGITSKVMLKIGAMTDGQIYRFINSLLTEFPGYIKITSLTMTKQSEITESTLKSAARGNFPDMVKAEIEFNWIGVREVTEESSKNNNQQRR